MSSKDINPQEIQSFKYFIRTTTEVKVATIPDWKHVWVIHPAAKVESVAKKVVQNRSETESDAKMQRSG